MVTEILTGVVEQPHNQNVTLPQIDKILHKVQSSYLPKILEEDEQKKQVQDNWVKFAQKHEVTYAHLDCIKKLKVQRIKKAHPHLKIHEAKKEIRTASLDENDRRICMELLTKMENMGIRTMQL